MQTTLEITPETRRRFIAAGELIHARIGHNPSPEFLMALMIETAPHSEELADTFCATIWRHMTPAKESA